jgi:hypothetical protein
MNISKHPHFLSLLRSAAMKSEAKWLRSEVSRLRHEVRKRKKKIDQLTSRTKNRTYDIFFFFFVFSKKGVAID